MAVEVKMPNLGLSIVEGTIERWFKKEGDQIAKGDPLVAISTEKVAVDIPAEVSGVVLKILYDPGIKVKVDQTIAFIGSPGEKIEDIPKPAALEIQTAPPAESPAQVAEEKKDLGDLKVSPLAIRIAAENGVDIQDIIRKFPGAKIGKKEVFAFLEEKKGQEQKLHAAPGADEEEVMPLRGALRAMADHMALSTRTAARVTTVAEVDMTELVKLRNSKKESFQNEHGIHLTFVPFVVKAIAEGIKEFPILNASLRGEEVVIHRSVNVGIAVDAGDSLLVPVVKDVGKKGLVAISQEIERLSSLARDRKLSLQEIQAGTITLTNAGVYGALMATPIIHQPQSAILWMGKIMETPVVRDGQIVIRSMMYLCLSYDHRIIMGAQAVRFLQKVKNHLENPGPLFTF
jgi:2-oxoglutarate dehydrogenase complex dihydrolipoamide succinyltransferase (E2) component